MGSDHAGFELKNHLVSVLRADGHDVVDHGPRVYDPDDDYPIFCIPAAEGVAVDPGSLGVVIGGSGNGEQIAANKVIGIRAALVYDAETAELARQHNDANVIAIGARMHDADEASALVRTFLNTGFSAQARHARRIQQISSYELRRGTEES
jgi:ribose 5-phosphate isomerase B